MAKANLKLSRIGNDGYEYARRIDGEWFIREGFYSSSYGWTKTKWRQVSSHPDDMVLINKALTAHEAGETICVVGFSSQLIITDGKGLRLPN